MGKDPTTTGEVVSTFLEHCSPILAGSGAIRLQDDAFVRTLETPIIRFLGINICVMGDKSDGKSRYSVHLRWQLLRCRALICRLERFSSFWTLLCSMSCFLVHSAVPIGSPIVEACCGNDIPMIQNLFLLNYAHPNDTTEENLTLLYVSRYHVNSSC
jgi:hypothetical protein